MRAGENDFFFQFLPSGHATQRWGKGSVWLKGHDPAGLKGPIKQGSEGRRMVLLGSAVFQDGFKNKDCRTGAGIINFTDLK